jgi:hypothetical protein
MEEKRNMVPKVRYQFDVADLVALSYLESSGHIDHFLQNVQGIHLMVCPCDLPLTALVTLIKTIWNEPPNTQTYIQLILDSGWIWGMGFANWAHL